MITHWCVFHAVAFLIIFKYLISNHYPEERGARLIISSHLIRIVSLVGFLSVCWGDSSRFSTIMGILRCEILSDWLLESFEFTQLTLFLLIVLYILLKYSIEVSKLVFKLSYLPLQIIIFLFKLNCLITLGYIKVARYVYLRERVA